MRTRFAGVAQLVERNLAKVEVESSRLFSRSKSKGKHPRFPLIISSQCSVTRRDSKAVMHRIANPMSPVRLWVAPPNTRPGGEIGRHNGLKIRRLEKAVPVQFRSRAPSTLPFKSNNIQQTKQIRHVAAFCCPVLSELVLLHPGAFGGIIGGIRGNSVSFAVSMPPEMPPTMPPAPFETTGVRHAD